MLKFALLILLINVATHVFSQTIDTGNSKKDSTSAPSVIVRSTSETQIITRIPNIQFNTGMYTGVDQVLEGKVPGLQVIQNQEPGGQAIWRLRGPHLSSSILYVIDGIPLDMSGGQWSLSILHPTDVKEVLVYRDGAAAALYGIRGAGGVALINTKSAESPELTISYNGSYGLSFLTRPPDFLSTSEFRQAIQTYAPSRVNYMGNADTDWMNEVTRIAQSTQQTLAVSQALKKTELYGSVNFFQNAGVLHFSRNQKLNALFSVEQKLLNDNLVLQLTSRNSFTNDLLGPNVLETAAAFDPTQPVKDSNGEYFEWPSTLTPGNPVATQQFTDNQGQTSRTLSNISAEYNFPFAPGLSLKAGAALDYADENTTAVTLPDQKQGAWVGGYMLTRDQYSKSLFYETTLSYNRLSGKHAVHSQISLTNQTFALNQNSLWGEQLVYENGEYKPTANLMESSFENEYSIKSFLGLFGYSFHERYYVDASVRLDEPSTFNSSGLFPALSIAWKISNESFASDWGKNIAGLRVRASYGISGHDPLRFYTPTNATELTSEQTVSLNAGLEGTFFKKFVASLDFYSRSESDFIIPVFNGTIFVDENAGSIKNRGIELFLATRAVSTEKFNWDISFNVSANRSKAGDFPYSVRSGSISGDVGQTIKILQNGESLGAYYAYEHKRNADGSLVLDPNDDDVQSSIEMYEDINGDGVIDDDDLVPHKDSNPSALIGLTSNMVFGSWDFSFTLKGAFGNYVYNNIASANGYLQRLSEGNINNNIHTSAIETGLKTKQLLSNYYVQNASFIKIPNLVLGYSFKPQAFGKIRAYFQAQNLLTLSKYKGMDPEIVDGIDTNLYPRSLTVIAGLSVTLE